MGAWAAPSKDRHSATAQPVQHDTPQTIYARLLELAAAENPRLVVTFPVELPADTSADEVAQWLSVSGYTKVQAEREVDMPPPPEAAVAGGKKGARKARGSDDVPRRRKLLDVVADALHLAPGEVEPTGSFADYGADSIISVELVRRINARFGIELKTTALFNFATVRDLARFIEIEFADALATTVPAPAPVERMEEGKSTSVDRRVAEAKGKTRRLRERIEARRQAAPVNTEAEFLAREAVKSGEAPSPDRGAAPTLEQLLTRLEAGEIDVDEAMALEVVDDA